MGSEKIIETKVRKFLEERNFLTFKIHTGQYGPEGFPDLIVIRKGITSYLEMKGSGGAVSPIQRYMISRLSEAGCLAGVAWNIDDVCSILKLEGIK
jgi:hypothetical protein